MLSSKWSSVSAYPHRTMTLHSSTENSLAELNHKILEANSQVQNVKRSPNLSFNKSIVARAVLHESLDFFVSLPRGTVDGMIVIFSGKKEMSPENSRQVYGYYLVTKV
ncbi:hypothetical protein TNCV_2538931 [Trichonephila clavipes]|nr:hypothetical protein TNCV_2538931 [Trichonephila clavipes]